MTTDKKDVDRFEPHQHREMRWDVDGDYILFSAHERVVGELIRETKGLSQSLTETFKSEEELRAALAASRAEVEGLRAGIAKALDEIEDDGPKAMKYAAQELRAAMEKGNV